MQWLNVVIMDLQLRVSATPRTLCSLRGIGNMKLQSRIATLKLYVERLYYFIMYFRKTVKMPHPLIEE